jgi:hypothetical protein
MGEPTRIKDLPDDTVLLMTPRNPALRKVAYIRNHPTDYSQWRGTDGSYVSDVFLQDYRDQGVSLIPLVIGDPQERL